MMRLVAKVWHRFCDKNQQTSQRVKKLRQDELRRFAMSNLRFYNSGEYNMGI